MKMTVSMKMEMKTQTKKKKAGEEEEERERKGKRNRERERKRKRKRRRERKRKSTRKSTTVAFAATQTHKKFCLLCFVCPLPVLLMWTPRSAANVPNASSTRTICAKYVPNMSV